MPKKAYKKTYLRKRISSFDRYNTQRERPGVKKAKDSDSSSSGSEHWGQGLPLHKLYMSSTLDLTATLPPPPNIRHRSATPLVSARATQTYPSDDFGSEDESTTGSPSKQN